MFGAKPIRHVKHTIIKDETPKSIYTRRNEIVQRLLADECELCGAKGRTEGHHIRKLADIKKYYELRLEAIESGPKITWLHGKDILPDSACY